MNIPWLSIFEGAPIIRSYHNPNTGQVTHYVCKTNMRWGSVVGAIRAMVGPFRPQDVKAAGHVQQTLYRMQREGEVRRVGIGIWEVVK